MANVLVLDDSEDILVLYEHILRYGDHVPTLVTNTGDFENELKKSLPDLIIIDVLLQHADGREICKSLKNNSNTKEIPVLVLSANERFLKNRNEYGADAVMAKPFDIKKLTDKIKDLVK